MSDDGLVQEIGKLLTAGPFHGGGHREPWARPRLAGVRTSRRRVLRLTRERGLPARRRVGAPHGPKAHGGTITTDRVDPMRGADPTSVVTGEGRAAVSVAVDHCPAERVGTHAGRSADRLEALEPVRRAVRERLGAFGKGVAAGSATTTGASTRATTSGPSSASPASRARRPSCASPRATAARNGSSAP